MKSVVEAMAIILDGVVPIGEETVRLEEIEGRIAARDLIAAISQPPFSASAMDGYAVRFQDAGFGQSLHVIGEAPAGAPFEGKVQAGTAVRIFTGGVIPEGADHVVIQEDIARDGEVITIIDEQKSARNIRPAGLDFKANDVLAQKGERFGLFHGALLAAANLPEAMCYKRPRVALFSSGDELRVPGSDLAPGEIVNSNHYGVSALIRAVGGEPDYLGCATDNLDEIEAMYRKAAGADIILPIGGASVGDYDHMRTGFAAAGGERVFEKVAVKPGKPTWFGKLGASRVLGLPGNPAAALVVSCLFVQALIARMTGTETSFAARSATTYGDLPANGPRETYLRARQIGVDKAGPRVQAFRSQDSSLLSAFTKCDVLIRRLPHAAAVKAGARVDIIPIGPLS